MNKNQEAFENDLDFDFDEMEKKLEEEIEEELSNLELLREDKEKIGNPDALGKVVLDEVWKQFGCSLSYFYDRRNSYTKI